MKSSWPETDNGIDDPFEWRHFYELMQCYRWSRDDSQTIQAFEAVKNFCREAMRDQELVYPPIDLGMVEGTK